LLEKTDDKKVSTYQEEARKEQEINRNVQDKRREGEGLFTPGSGGEKGGGTL
jgi:hypothetical protein